MRAKSNFSNLSFSLFPYNILKYLTGACQKGKASRFQLYSTVYLKISLHKECTRDQQFTIFTNTYFWFCLQAYEQNIGIGQKIGDNVEFLMG